MRKAAAKQQTLVAILEENALLREEVQVARRASDITARLVVEQFVKVEGMLHRLEESERRYRELYHQASQRQQLYESLLNSTPDAVVIHTLKGQISYVNPAFSRMFGFSREEVQERDAHFFIPPSESPQHTAIIKQIVAGEPVSIHETKRLHKNGAQLDVALSASCYADHQGKPAGIMMTLRDITQNKQAELLLQKERETFFTILQEAPYGVGMLDKDEKIVYLNPEFTKTIGYTLDDIPTLSTWFEKAYPAPSQRRTAIENWRLQAPRGKRDKEFSVVCKDGRTKAIEFRRAVLQDGRVIVMLSDVTEKKRTVEQLEQAKKQWERTFDAIDDAITIQDPDMRMLRVNRAAARLFGVDKEELIGRWCFEAFADRQDACPGCPQLLTSKDHAHHSSEIRHAKLGKIFLVTTSPIFDEHGRFSSIVHSAKDITDRRAIEEELIKAQKLESVGILAGGIAHDFNNILTTILGNVTLAKMYAGANDKAFARLEEAEKACLRAKDLTHQLLTFSRGGAPIKRATCIADLVKESASFAMMGSKVRCRYDIAADLWPVEIDEGQMSQVINNLVINACQAMPDGGDIDIRLDNVTLGQSDETQTGSGQYVRMTIRDQGIGIPEENLAKVFDPYFTTKAGGSGLGLSMAYSIIKRHDGLLTVESEQGRGTTFHIYLPATQKRATGVLKRDDNPVCGSGRGRVLVMDDERPIRDLAREMLSFLGYEVELAVDGNEAMARYEQANRRGAPFNAVIMDLTIPGGMGGKEAIAKLRQIDDKIKVIVSSGYHTDPIMSNFSEYGFNGVIAKPYKLKDLGEVLRNLLTAER